MLCRAITAALVIFCATLPASALTIKPFDEALATAAARMKVKDFAGARQAAQKSTQGGARAFLTGMADVRLEMWDEAASQLAFAADNYPILADYALYNEGLALSKIGRAEEALTPLYRLLKQYPESRLARAATLLYADSLYAGGHYKEALQSYTTFIERYPSGSDSIAALFNSALCRDKTGDPGGAAGVLRGIWLNYPTSPLAEKAAAELRRVQASGVQSEPYSTAELFKRGGILYDLGRYAKAAEAYSALLVNSEGSDFNAKLKLKYGQALFKARHYQDAQSTLKALYQTETGNTAAEAGIWLGRALDKNGKRDDAYSLYLRLSDPAKGGTFADDALLEAAYLKRFQRHWSEAQQLFKSYLASYPEHQKDGNVVWEVAWSGYQSRDYRGAAAYFRKLAQRDDMREKALYWLAKCLAASGDAAGAEASYAALAKEYPFGYYTLLCGRWCDITQFPAPPRDLAEAIPMPAGYEREKALIALGLYDEAGRELSAKKNKNALAIARLYLEMGNYNGAYHTVASLKLKRGEQSSGSIWGINYPLAFRNDVVKNAAANAIPESLVYAIMRAESNYHPGARSPVGAVGLMQIMPATAERISKGDSGKLTRPDLNIRLGSKHLKYLMGLYDKNIPLTAAAYNAGSGNVKRWQKGLGSLPQDEFVESIPFRETREYVKKVLTNMELYQRLYRLGQVKQVNAGSQKTDVKNMTTEDTEAQGGKPSTP